jgi:hypothetical protein
MSNRYTTKKELVKGLNTSSIKIMKVVGAFVNPKGMTNHLKRLSLDLKVVFHTGNLVVARIYVNLVEEIYPLELV